jgi:hypothetical protein
VTIRQFQPGDETKRYFRMEKKDEESLLDPQGTILNAGGRIFFALSGEQCVGCCALLRLAADEFEVAKMAVAPPADSFLRPMRGRTCKWR